MRSRRGARRPAPPRRDDGGGGRSSGFYRKRWWTLRLWLRFLAWPLLHLVLVGVVFVLCVRWRDGKNAYAFWHPASKEEDDINTQVLHPVAHDCNASAIDALRWLGFECMGTVWRLSSCEGRVWRACEYTFPIDPGPWHKPGAPPTRMEQDTDVEIMRHELRLWWYSWRLHTMTLEQIVEHLHELEQELPTP